MRLCSYIVTNDHGLAPNPFWGYCTLAVCTPNHMGIRAAVGDWFAGITSRQHGNKLLYAMQVSEVMPFEQYDADPRFESKKPVLKGSWRQLRGDNLYFRDEHGEWQQRPNVFHSLEYMERDLRHPRVFIGKHFYYFGENAVAIPPAYKDLILRRQGCKCNHDPAMVDGFLAWLQNNFQPDVHGEPYDRPAKIGNGKVDHLFNTFLQSTFRRNLPPKTLTMNGKYPAGKKPGSSKAIR